MGMLFMILLFLVLAYVFHKLSIKTTEWARDRRARRSLDEAYKSQLLNSVERIGDAVDPPEQPPDYLEGLLKANRELIENEKDKETVKGLFNELGLK